MVPSDFLDCSAALGPRESLRAHLWLMARALLWPFGLLLWFYDLCAAIAADDFAVEWDKLIAQEQRALEDRHSLSESLRREGI